MTKNFIYALCLLLVIAVSAHAQQPPAAQDSLNLLKRNIERITQTTNADWGIYIKSLDTGEEVAINADTVMDTMTSTTYVADLVGRTREILGLRRYGVYQIVNEGTCSYHDFAVEAAGIAGLSVAQAERLIEVVTEAEMGRSAPRPRWTPMRCLLSAELNLSPMRDWRNALADYAHYKARR